MKLRLQLVTKIALRKWGHFERAKPIFKKLPVSLAESISTTQSNPFQRVSVGQRAAKLRSLKL